MSLFTRSFRRETKHLPQHRPSILWPSLETFKINFKSLLYSFHGPSASSIFILKLCWPSNQCEVGWAWVGGMEVAGVVVWCGCCPWPCLQHLTWAGCWPQSSLQPLSLPAVWQTFPYVLSALITLLKAKLDLYGRGSQLEASK